MGREQVAAPVSSSSAPGILRTPRLRRLGATGAMPMPRGGAVAITPARTSPPARAQRDSDRALEPSVCRDEATIRLPRAIQVAVVPRSDACRQFLASPGIPASMRRRFRSERPSSLRWSRHEGASPPCKSHRRPRLISIERSDHRQATARETEPLESCA